MRPIQCHLCGSSETFLFMKGIFDSLITEVIECADCGMQFLNPMMSDKEEENYYKDYYKRQQKRNYKKFSLEEIQENSFKHYTQHYDLFHKVVRGKKCILEIGSGAGGFIRFVKENCPGAKIVAVEKSKPSVNFLKNSYKDLRLLNDIKDLGPKQRFDLIAGFGILEHIKDGESFLSYLRNFLANKDSLAVFSVTNKRNPLIDIYGLDEFKKFSYMKQHPCTYSEKALKILAKKSGYSIEHMSYVQVWGLDNHMSWLKNREPREFSKYTKILSQKTLKAYRDDLVNLKITDLIVVVMKKYQRRESGS